MQVFFELGNSRIKAATLSKNEYRYLGAESYQPMDDFDVTSLFDFDEKSLEKVYLASVASAQVMADLIESIQQAWRVYPTILTTQPSCCGIQCGYDSFERLGVDRWMAIIGACSGSAKPKLIVDMGTALTVDLVIDRVHQGGFIVPGLRMMRESLVSGTAIDLNAYQQNDALEGSLLGKTTEEGIMGGTLYMVAAYLNHLVADLENETGRLFECVGTGGDFQSVQPMLDKPFEYVEDLTIQGMIEVIESL